MADAHANFAYTNITNNAGTTNPSTTVTVTSSAQAALFPAVPFNATIWPTGVQPTYTGVAATTAEIVRVTAYDSNVTFTITRVTEDVSQTIRNIVIGDQMAATVTKKTFTDIEANYVNSWSPAIAVSAGTGLQTLAANSSQSGTNNLYVFPMTLPFPTKFNQIIMAHSLAYTTNTTVNTSGSNTYFSNFGIYSMTSNSMALISSNSFSIVESLSNNSGTAGSFTWNFPTTTATAGYGYGSFTGGNPTGTAQMFSYVTGLRAMGLQFGGEMSLSAGMYWLGILTYRSTSGATSVLGFSHAGIIGQIINPINMAGTVSGLNPFGMAAAEFAQSNVRISAWNGRFIMGFATNTAQNGFGGTRLPGVLELANFQTAQTTATILPLVSFVST